MYKPKRKFVSLILSQQEKGEKLNMEIAIMQPPPFVILQVYLDVKYLLEC